MGFSVGFLARRGGEECFERGYGIWMAITWQLILTFDGKFHRPPDPPCRRGCRPHGEE